MSNQLEIAMKVGGVVALAMLLFLPSVIGQKRRVAALRSISALNALILLTLLHMLFWIWFGWITAGLWVVAMIWASVGKKQNA